MTFVTPRNALCHFLKNEMPLTLNQTFEVMITKILVPTDFSYLSSQAVQVAIELATRFNAEIILYTNLNLPTNWDELPEDSKKHYPEELQRIYNINVLFRDYSKQIQANGVKSTLVFSGGDISKSIQRVCDKHQVDFIVMATHGLSRINELLVESNTQTTIRGVHCPVLAIKEDMTNLKFKNLVFASSFNEVDKPAFEKVLAFAKMFDSTIHLVCINTSSFFTQPGVLIRAAMDDFEKMCGAVPCKKHFYSGFDIESGVVNFAERVKADLIAISNHTTHPIRRIVKGRNPVDLLVNRAQIPVLTLDYAS